MKKEDYDFLHDLTNKLSKIDGYLGMLKTEIGEDNDKIMKIEKATTEALELVGGYRARLEVGAS